MKWVGGPTYTTAALGCALRGVTGPFWGRSGAGQGPLEGQDPRRPASWRLEQPRGIIELFALLDSLTLIGRPLSPGARAHGAGFHESDVGFRPRGGVPPPIRGPKSRRRIRGVPACPASISSRGPQEFSNPVCAWSPCSLMLTRKTIGRRLPVCWRAVAAYPEDKWQTWQESDVTFGFDGRTRLLGGYRSRRGRLAPAGNGPLARAFAVGGGVKPRTEKRRSPRYRPAPSGVSVPRVPPGHSRWASHP